MPECPLAKIEIGNEKCPNRRCVWNTKKESVTNGCIAIHEPQYEHLTTEEVAEHKGIKDCGPYISGTKHLILLLVLLAEYVEYIRDNVNLCKALDKVKHKRLAKIKELSIGNLMPYVLNPANYRKFCMLKNPVVKVELDDLLSTIEQGI